MMGKRTGLLASCLVLLAACSSKNDDASDSTSGKSLDQTSVNPATGAPVGQTPDVGKGCQAPEDCTSLICVDGACTEATSADGVKNQDETGIDCGGSVSPKCGDGLGCSVADDCTSLVCGADKLCAAPTATDGVKNGDESDVDCGGTKTGAPKCAQGLACVANADCASDGCGDNGLCVDDKSCTKANGGRTCGTGEVGEPTAKHESCCSTLKIPGRATRLDKYKVTSGRMRQFIERVNGNVLGWYESNKNQLSAAARAQIEPFKGNLSQDLESFPLGAKFQLGGYIYLTDRPSTLQGCFTGNASNRANGSHTYFTGTFEGEDRGFDQAFLDRLPLNCVTYPMMAAFCAWDGGRLQTKDENDAAYGSGNPYPWGASPQAGGFATINGKFTQVGPATNDFSTTACPGCNANMTNWRLSYQFPEGGNPAKPWDFAYWMSAPGRFPQDSGPNGHKDIAGDLIEITATAGGADAKYGATMKWSRAGSWEGHAIANRDSGFAVMTKYGKVGGRCARD